MLQQVHSTGIESRSECEMCTVIVGHHGGLRLNPKPAIDSTEADSKEGRGWISTGSTHLHTVPARLVPKNVVSQPKWKLIDDLLQKVLKWRVTTDDSHRPKGKQSRNEAMPREEWPGCQFPTLRNFAEAVAIVKSLVAEMGLKLGQKELERVALWALDLSDVYRMLAVNRSKWWLQQFLWSDGVRLDYRCIFGSANLPGLFERVTLFVLAVAAERIDAYDKQHPYSGARQQWHAWREKWL